MFTLCLLVWGGVDGGKLLLVCLPHVSPLCRLFTTKTLVTWDPLLESGLLPSPGEGSFCGLRAPSEVKLMQLFSGAACSSPRHLDLLLLSGKILLLGLGLPRALPLVVLLEHAPFPRPPFSDELSD